MSAPELFERHPANPILSAEDWPYPVNAVFNPAAATVDGKTVLLVRVEDRRGISHLTVARSTDGVGDWSIDAEPLLAPIRRFLPNTGGLDISPVILILLIILVKEIIERYIYPYVF